MTLMLRNIYGLFALCGILLMRLFSFTNPKIQRGIELRKSKPWTTDNHSTLKTIWFHVSSGELEYAKPVIRELKKKNYRIVVTYFSPSVVKNLEAFQEVDFQTPTPWETKKDWKAFIDAQRPGCLAIARTDLWPEMLWTALDNGIPAILFSATLPAHSKRVSNFAARFFYSALLEKMGAISCVTDEDKLGFEKILGSKVPLRVDGDTRYDQVIHRLAEKRPLSPAFESWMNGKTARTFIAGSTWPEDEEVLLSVFPLLIEKGWQVILVPHEPTDEHVRGLRSQLQSIGLGIQKYSEQAKPEQAKIHIVDKVGVLADMYHAADLAFVGGSFKKSVHSVMEPNASGVFTVFGPHHQNNREAMALVDAGLNESIGNAESFKQLVLRESALGGGERALRSQKILHFIQERSGSSKKIVQWIDAQFNC